MATLTKEDFKALKSIVLSEKSGQTYITGVEKLPIKEGYNENIKVFIMLDNGDTISAITSLERHKNLRAGEATFVKQEFAKTDKYEANTKWLFTNV